MMPCIRYCLALSFLIHLTHIVQAIPAVTVHPVPIMHFTIAPYLYGTEKKYWPSMHLNGGTLLDFNHRFAAWGAMGIRTLPHLSLPDQYQWWTAERELIQSERIDSSGISLSTLNTSAGMRFVIIPKLIAGIYCAQDETLAHYAANSDHSSAFYDTTHTHKFNRNRQIGAEILHPLYRVNIGWYFDTSGTPMQNTGAVTKQPRQNRALTSNNTPYIYKASSKLLLPLQDAIVVNLSILSGKTKPFLSTYYIPCEKYPGIWGFSAGCKYDLHAMVNSSFGVKYDTIQNWRVSLTLQSGWLGAKNSNTQYKDNVYYLNQPFHRESMPFIFLPDVHLAQAVRLCNQSKVSTIQKGLNDISKISHPIDYILQNSTHIKEWLDDAKHLSTQDLLSDAYQGIFYRDHSPANIERLFAQLKAHSPKIQAIVDKIDFIQEFYTQLLKMANGDDNSDSANSAKHKNTVVGGFPDSASEDESDTSGSSSSDASKNQSAASPDEQQSTPSQRPPVTRALDRTPTSPPPRYSQTLSTPTKHYTRPPLALQNTNNHRMPGNPILSPTKDRATRIPATFQRKALAQSSQPADSSHIKKQGDDTSLEAQTSSSGSSDNEEQDLTSNSNAAQMSDNPPIQPAQYSRHSSSSNRRPSLTLRSQTDQSQGTTSTRRPSVRHTSGTQLHRTTSTPSAKKQPAEPADDNSSIYTTGTTTTQQQKTMKKTGFFESLVPSSTSKKVAEPITLTAGQTVYQRAKFKDGTAIVDWKVLFSKDRITGQMIPTLTRTKEDGTKCTMYKNVQYLLNENKNKAEGRAEGTTDSIDFNKPDAHGVVQKKRFYLEKNKNDTLTGRFEFRADGGAVKSRSGTA